MTNEEIEKYKYVICCPMCDNEKCVKGTEKCEAKIWAEKKKKVRKYDKRRNSRWA